MFTDNTFVTIPVVSMFFVPIPSSVLIVLRVVVGILLISLGWLGDAIINSFFNPIRYTTTSYYEILLLEWLPAAKPIFLSFVPALFLTLKLVFVEVAWKKLSAVALVSGIVLSVPVYLHNLKLWQPLTQTIDDLPVIEVKYIRHTGTFPDVPDKMTLTFVIPYEDFPKTDQTIKTRLAEHKGLAFSDFLENYILKNKELPDTEYEYWYMVDKQTADRIEAQLDRIRF